MFLRGDDVYFKINERIFFFYFEEEIFVFVRIFEVVRVFIRGILKL